MSNPGANLEMEINVHAVKALMDSNAPVRYFDVRTDEELAIARIPGTEHLTEELAERISRESRNDQRMIFICHHGMRSMAAAMYFYNLGFVQSQSMAGGIDAWSLEIDKTIPTY